ncbi:hypothetical protein [Saccharothrix australiensis]|uniref:hypothetical protein n=1 Tax=Saccharothrix australiensis TaxID=2072 RepID=UPI0014778864|nr:hypothetical protein [Saccharothrix australiensis]
MSRVRRLLSRALLVGGGALAGTAAAWALSAAPAAAQAADHEGVVGVVTRVVAEHRPVQEAVAPVRATVRDLDTTATVRDLDTALRAQRAEDVTPPDLGQVAEEIRGAVDRVGSWFEHPTAVPVRGEHRAGRPQHGGRVAEARPTETAPTATAVPVSLGTPVVQGPFSLLGEIRAASAEQSPGALPADEPGVRRGEPVDVPLAPFTPPFGVPAHCSCGGDGAGSAAGGSGPATGVTADGVDTAVARALLPATERNTTLPGKQPGTTPD